MPAAHQKKQSLWLPKLFGTNFFRMVKRFNNRFYHERTAIPSCIFKTLQTHITTTVGHFSKLFKPTGYPNHLLLPIKISISSVVCLLKINLNTSYSKCDFWTQIHSKDNEKQKHGIKWNSTVLNLSYLKEKLIEEFVIYWSCEELQELKFIFNSLSLKKCKFISFSRRENKYHPLSDCFLVVIQQSVDVRLKSSVVVATVQQG